jgi:hypothetical protein
VSVPGVRASGSWSSSRGSGSCRGSGGPASTAGVARAGGAPDVEQYFVEGRVELTISERFFWNAGTSWDRNHDAGIRNRYVSFGGVGNVWAD